MALDENTLGPAIAAALEGLTAEQKKDLTVIWTTISKAILDHFKTQGVVTSTGATAVGTPGGPLPITNLPGGIS